MYSPLTIGRKYMQYLLQASNGKGHGIHSPFVFEFVTRVLNDHTDYPNYERIEQVRKALLTDHRPVSAEDYGAGAAGGNRAIRQATVASITARSAKSPKYARLLYRIAQFYQPHHVLELGTSLGISTAYLACAAGRPVVITGEGNPVLAGLAGDNFRKLGLNNIRVVTGNFDDTLPGMIAEMRQLHLAFVDGNHREQPTLDYFHRLLAVMTDSSIMIFDDIYWSNGMESAWSQICEHPSVMLSIDLFQMGIVFFRPEFLVKQHFRIRF